MRKDHRGKQGATLGATIGGQGWSDMKRHVAKIEKADKEAKRRAKAEKKRKAREARKPFVNEKLRRHQERR